MPHASLNSVSLSTCDLPGTQRTVLLPPRLDIMPMRAETRPGAREERDILSLSSPSLHFNQGLRYKILLFRACQLQNLKYPHALSQLLLHKRERKKKITKNKTPKPTQRKEVFSFLLLFKNITKKWGEGREFLDTFPDLCVYVCQCPSCR